METTRVRIAIAVGVLVALTGACSGSSAAESTTTTVPLTVPTTTVPVTTSTPDPDNIIPVPPALIPAGCAAETARDLATFEAALADRPTLAELCAVVGPPDWLDMNIGPLIYDLNDGGQINLVFGGIGEPVIYAVWVGPGGEARSLIDG